MSAIFETLNIDYATIQLPKVVSKTVNLNKKLD